MPPAYEVLLLNTTIPQIQAAQSGDTYVVPRDIAINATAIISANSATDALRITQTGAGNAILVEDSANPDATPFVVTAAGDVGVGASSPGYALDVQKSVANGVVANFQSTSTSAVNTGVAFRSSASNAANRNWALLVNSSAFGDFVIRTSTTNGGDPVSGTDRLMIDPSGNLGLGVTPSDWNANNKVFQLSNNASLFSRSGFTGVAQNFRYDSADTGIFMSAGYATLYYQNAGKHSWAVSTTSWSGSGSNIAALSDAMTLDASGNLVVGGTSAPSLRITSFKEITANNDATTGVGIVRFGTTYGSNLYHTYTTNAGSGNDGEAFGLIVSDGSAALTDKTKTKYLVAQNGTHIWYGSTTSNERARITSVGDFLVGTQTLGGEGGFSVSPAGSNGAAQVVFDRANTTNTSFSFVFENANTTVGTISYTNTATAYNTTSDYRLKDNPQPLTGSGAFIDALKPKTWDWKLGGKGVGFIAHEVAEVSPGTVVGEKDAVDADGKPVMQAMEYGSAEFIANIIAELQSLRARVKALEGA